MTLGVVGQRLKDRIIIRLPYSQTLYLCSTKGVYFEETSRDSFIRDAERTNRDSYAPDNLPVQFNVITTKSYGPGMLGVKVEITNTGNCHINQCDATCILLDSYGKKIGFQRHYVIKSTEGGLGPGNSTYFEYVVDVRPEIVDKILFHVEQIR